MFMLAQGGKGDQGVWVNQITAAELRGEHGAPYVLPGNTWFARFDTVPRSSGGIFAP